MVAEDGQRCLLHVLVDGIEEGTEQFVRVLRRSKCRGHKQARTRLSDYSTVRSGTQAGEGSSQENRPPEAQGSPSTQMTIAELLQPVGRALVPMETPRVP